MMKLQILLGKNHTIIRVLHETFPVLKCFDNEKLELINRKTVTYIHVLIIDSVSIQSEETINARALEHESTMLDAYTEMETDSFKSQLQTVLTAYYQDIKRVTCASGGRKSKVVKRRFHDAAPRPNNDSCRVDMDCSGEAAAAAEAAA
jgi:hypothetical protein